MKVYDVYYRATPPRLIRKHLTEDQMDLLWKELKWWEKNSLLIKEISLEEREEER